MRIFHVMTHLRLGAGRAIVDLCREQRRRGHQVHLAVSADAEGTWASDGALLAELEAHGVPVACIGDVFHRDRFLLADAADALRSLAGAWTDETIAHAHTAMTGAVASWAGARRIAVTCHGWNLRRPAEYDLQDTLALSLAGGVISPSADWAGRLAALPGIDRVTVVPNGFDLARYPPQARRPRMADAPRVICVGELTRRKGQDVLVQAMPLLWETWPGATLDLAGDGDMAAALEQQAAMVDPDGGRIRLHGHVRDPYPLLGDADVFCLPSRSDNQPVAIIEAMLAGLPVVSTDVGGIPEMLAVPGAGETVPAESVAALADALRRQLMAPDEGASASVEAFARHAYGVPLMADRIEAIYGSIGVTGPGTSGREAVVDPLRPT